MATKPQESTPGTVQRDTADAIEKAALQVFFEKGYHGASIREIASGAGIGIATLFHHYQSKAAILDQIMDIAAEEMWADLREAVKGVSNPSERLRLSVRALALAHCERQSYSFVAQSEYRSLEPEAKEMIRAKRRRTQGLFDSIVLEGISSGEFCAAHPKEVSRAIVAIGTAVGGWYRPNQDYTPDEVAEINVEMAFRLVGAARGTGPPRRGR
jgi:AcrR family transcriptional regulator